MKKIILAILAVFSAVSCGAARKAVPVFTDLDLVGYHHREPHEWSAERFAPHVSFKTADGSESWLFEAFLFVEGQDVKHNHDFCITPTGTSAPKTCWQDLLDFWLGPEGSVASLEKACKAAARRIGRPPHKRYVVITVPDPVMFERFGNKTSSTKYWGSLDGRQLDFADVNDQIAACRWYIDSARRMFAELHCKYLELAGFYILSEEIYLPYAEDPADRLNCQYKRWETIVPALASYCHERKEGLWWIPYNLAPGYEYWQRLGLDMAWMQPGYYWSPSKSFDRTVDEIRKYGMGMEFEMEFTCVRAEMERVGRGPDGEGRLVFGPGDVPMLKERFREYMRRFKEAGFYGSVAPALYSGTNTLTQLATSPYDEDVALYREFCEFIIGNPLRKKK